MPRDPNAEEVDTEEFVGAVQTFDDYLLQQLAMMDLSRAVARAARAIVGSLDDDGFFCVSLEEISQIAGVDSASALQGLEIVQQLDPPGVGARTLAEALRLQMEYLGIEEPLLLRIIDEHLDDVAASHFRKVARAMQVDEEEVRRLVEILRQLNPRPAGAFSPGPSPGYIVPDVTLRRFDDEWVIIPNTEAVPSLRVSSRYRSMLREGSRADKDTVRYLKDKIRSAETFIRNVDRRKDTVSRIAQIILEVQGEFFEDGKGPLRPLRLEDVAVEIGVHLSTVSRGVTGKYMATPYGMFELKHFFSGGYRTSTGMDVAATTVKNRLKEMLDGRGLGAAAVRPAPRRDALRGGHPGGAAHGREVPRGDGHRTVLGQEEAVEVPGLERTGRRATPVPETGCARGGSATSSIIAIMLAAITALHTLTTTDTPTQAMLHDFYRRLYYIPILYAAFLFGARGGLAAAAASALLYLPFYRMGTGGLLGFGIDNLLEVVMYAVMGVLFGSLRDADDRRTKDLMQVSSKLEDAYRALEERAMQLITIQDYTQSILRSVTSGVVTVGPDASVATVNPSAERILGVNEEQIVARALGTLFKDDGGLGDDVRKVLGGPHPADRARSHAHDGDRQGRARPDVRVAHARRRRPEARRGRDDRGRLRHQVAHRAADPRGPARGHGRADRGRRARGAQPAGYHPRVGAADGGRGMQRGACQRGGRGHQAGDRPAGPGDQGAPGLRPAGPADDAAVEVRQVLEEVALFSRTFASRGRVEIVEEYGEGVPEVMADPEQLKQVFVNLISNAVQAMSDGGTLTITTGTDGGFVFIRFTDDGPGIPAEILGKVFDPFVSTRDDGTGLGLTIVHRIVDDHDGHIEVTSEQGAGTTFTVWLPALQQEGSSAWPSGS